MADKTIEWLHAVRAQDAKKPFLAHFSTGCSHAPHHVFQSWAEKYKDKFGQALDGTPTAHRRRDRRSRDSGRLDPRLLASAPGCRSRGGAATVADTDLAAGRDETEQWGCAGDDEMTAPPGEATAR
jgi:arylsulfatase A-like enzyme